ncbi:MAG: SusD/RagB family nutrient-binding outer membrane lipoprotein [Bernardetiaceae bacterium]|nr:SusD/RagB family nutrient-binding outer membrane lipoprotein [Bernardetiaceae bacterium]
MKKFSIYILLALLALTHTACEKQFLEGYEDSPNVPQDVPMSSLLTQAEVMTYFVYGDDIARNISVVMQQMTGADRQFLALNRYVIGGTDFDPTWEFNAYSGALNDLRIIREKAEESNSPHYKGVAAVLTVMNLGILTDCFGDIPYSEAFQGNENLTPKYDTQEEIYNSMFALLDEAVSDLQAAESVLSPGADDLIYGGDLGLWLGLANSLRARYLNHLSKKGNYSAAAVLSAVNNGFSSRADEAIARFQSAAPQSNLWYQFTIVDRQGYIEQSGFMYDMMEAKNDPRIPFYRSEDLFEMPVFGQATSPMYLMSFAELKFIEAEASFRSGNTAGAASAFRAGIQASMEMAGVPADEVAVYLDAQGDLPAGQAALQRIMEEKYVALFTQGAEVWTDWRRTGFPNLEPFPGNQLGNIPRRLPYPQSEYLYNPNTPPLELPDNLLQPVWWDR